MKGLVRNAWEVKKEFDWRLNEIKFKKHTQQYFVFNSVRYHTYYAHLIFVEKIFVLSIVLAWAGHKLDEEHNTRLKSDEKNLKILRIKIQQNFTHLQRLSKCIALLCSTKICYIFTLKICNSFSSLFHRLLCSSSNLWTMIHAVSIISHLIKIGSNKDVFIQLFLDVIYSPLYTELLPHRFNFNSFMIS